MKILIKKLFQNSFKVVKIQNSFKLFKIHSSQNHTLFQNHSSEDYGSFI